MNKKIISILVAVVLLSIIISPNPGYSFDPTFVVEAEADCEFINLTWSSVSNANGYYVYRGIGQGNQVPEPLTDFPIKGNSYEDWNDIEAGVEYCYFIRAVGADHKEFAESNEVCAVPICPEDCRLELKFQVGNNVYWINDEPQPAMEAAPEVKWSRTFVLIRYAAETAGATVGWEGATKSITIETLDGTMIKMQVGNNKATINGKEMQIDANNSKVTPYIIAGRTLCPLRFTGVNLGATGPEDILWDGDTKSAMLYFRNPDCGNNGDDPVVDPGNDPVINPEPGVHNIFPTNAIPGSGTCTPPKGNPTKTSNFTTGLREDWIPIEYNEGAYNKYAKITGNGLDVNIAEDTFNYYGYPSKVGIRSKEPYLTITEEMKTNPLAITLDFDSAGTDNFMIILSRSNHPATSDHANPDSPGQNILVYFNTSPYKTQARFGLSYSRHPGPGDNGLSVVKHDRLTNITPDAPKQVTLTLKPNFIRATTTYGYKVESNDEAIHSLEIGTKLYLYIFTFAFDGKGQPVNMGLKSVKSFNGWSNTSDYTPPKGKVVYTENFDGNEGIRWVPIVSSEYAQNAKYDKNAKFGGGKFVASVPRVTVAHHGGFDDWSGVGIKSKYYFVEVTEDMAENPFTVFFDLEQDGSTGYRLMLGKNGGTAHTGFNINEFGTTPTFRLSNNILQYSKANDNGAYRHNILPVSPRYISLTIKPGVAKISTSHGFSNEITCDWLTVGSKLFLTARNIPDESDKFSPSSLTLNSIRAMRFEGKTFTDYKAPSGQLLYREEFDNEKQSKLKRAIFTGMHAYPPPECVVKEEHVKYQNGKLNVSIPGSSNPMGGYSLNRLGGVVMKYYPLFVMTDDLNKTPLKVTFKLDPANTTEFKIDFTARGGPKHTWDPFSHGDIQFHYQTTEKGLTAMSLKSGLVNEDNTEDELLRASTGVPETITFIFKPEQVTMTSSAGDKLSIRNITTLGLPKARGKGRISFQIYAYSHTEARKKPSAFKLSVDSITVTK